MDGPAKPASHAPAATQSLFEFTSPGIAARACAVVAILCVDKIVLNMFVDFDAAQTAAGAGAVARVIQHLGLRFLVTLAISLALLTYVRPNPALIELKPIGRGSPVRLRWLAVHVLLVALQAPLLGALYVEGRIAPSFTLQAGAVALLATGSVLALLAAAAPLSLWRRAARALGSTWLYAVLAGIAGTAAIQWTQALWQPTAVVTFQLVRALLEAFLPTLQADPEQRILSTDRFAVQVSEVCSGLEGLGLMLVFCCAWLAYFRTEYRFPRALLLIPAGLLLIFALNVVRIACLVLIGDAGFPEVARLGFHSQAGWIAFNGASCAIVLISRRITWLTSTPRSPESAASENPTAAFLLPFLAVLAAGMLARALSGGFEALYGLRLVAGVAALLFYRRQLAGLDWRFGWQAPLVGVAVFALWMIGERFVSSPTPMPEALAQAPATARELWICVRFLTAATLVPIVEELAYRGFLLRRLAAAQFESVPFSAVGRWPLLLSAVAFGLGHGLMSIPAVLAGLAYGGVVMRTARFGDAVVAHATTNFLLALVVLVLDQWQLW